MRCHNCGSTTHLRRDCPGSGASHAGSAPPDTSTHYVQEYAHIYFMDVEEEQAGEPEKRKAKDGQFYTKEEFLAFFGDLKAWEAAGVKKKARRGVKHKRSQEAMVDRIHRRLTIEYERAIRTCKCPPWEPHREGCGNVNRKLVSIVHQRGHRGSTASSSSSGAKPPSEPPTGTVMKNMPVPEGAIMKNAPFPAQKSHLDFVVQAAPKVTLLPKTAAGMPPPQVLEADYTPVSLGSAGHRAQCSCVPQHSTNTPKCT